MELFILSEMRKTTINIPADVYKNLRRIAVEKDTNQTELLREYIGLGIEKDKKYLKVR